MMVWLMEFGITAAVTSTGESALVANGLLWKGRECWSCFGWKFRVRMVTEWSIARWRKKTEKLIGRKPVKNTRVSREYGNAGR